MKHSSLVKLPSDHDFFSKTVKLNVPLPEFRRTKFCNSRTSVSDSWALPQTLLLAKFIPLYRSYWQISSLLVALDDPELLLHLQNTFQPILTQYLCLIWHVCCCWCLLNSVWGSQKTAILPNITNTCRWKWHFFWLKWSLLNYCYFVYFWVISISVEANLCLRRRF